MDNRDRDILDSLVKANYSISESLKGIKENLKELNDSNILHHRSVQVYQRDSIHDHERIIDTLKVMTDKYWWLIIALIAACLMVGGFTQAAKLFI